MMKKLLLLLFIIHTGAHAQTLFTTFEESKGTRSATYGQVMTFYEHLDKKYTTVQMREAGPTDVVYPLHVVLYNNSGIFDIAEWKKRDNLVLFINNGIHPGEPDGIDASMMLLRDAAAGKIKVPDNIMLAVIPVFNIGGALNRGSYSRANQNGPEEYGFRGSAQNLDLNRDFIKLDAKETQSLVQLFHKLDPDLFIDNHVSNGADYQHVMTLLSTQHNKLGGSMGRYLNETLEPLLYADMKQRGYNLVPYVNHWGHTPDKGWVAFHEGPRFASGFAALFQTYAFVPETHMLKPYKDRVEATYALMQSFMDIAASNADQIKATRKADRETMMKEEAFTLEWQADTTQPSLITFNGYEAGYKPSEVSGRPRLYYDRSKPYAKQVPFYNTYTAKSEFAVPKAYVIPQGWGRVIERLKMNGVQVQRLEKDTVMEVRVYTISGYETSKRPYEGHYLHTNVQATNEIKRVKLLKGDCIIPMEQRAKRYLVETLEPTGPDAFFAWGFFDAILQQKEYFSDYVFEDTAAELLKNNPELAAKLKAKQASDPAFAEDGAAQLDFVYRNSPYYEPVHMRYPVYRVEAP